MVDNKVPIIYLSGDELNTFFIQEDTNVSGHSYEWEGERVVHLRIHPVLHSYGVHGKSMFSKIDIAHYDNSVLADVLYFVQISVNGSIQVFEHVGDEWHERDVNFIPSHQELYSRSKGILEINILENKRFLPGKIKEKADVLHPLFLYYTIRFTNLDFASSSHSMSTELMVSDRDTDELQIHVLGP